MSSPQYTDVFVPGGYPRHTYNSRATLKLEDSIREVLNNLCKLVIVTGHTKSGKTVLVRNVLPREESIWIDGGSVGSEDDFWHIIINQLELFQTTSVQRTEEESSDANVSGEIEGNILFAKAKSTLESSTGAKEISSSTGSRAVSSRVAAFNGLRETRTPLVIDDFHYLPRVLQGDVVRVLKPLIFDGLPVVIIAIPHRRYDAVKVEREMTGRVLPVQIPLWEKDELVFIPDTGFAILNGKLPASTAERLAEESIGSPHLMQEFCRMLCKSKGVTTTFSGEEIEVSPEQLRVVLSEAAETIGRPIFEKLARGPRQRSDRIQRTLKTGAQVDIYSLVLHGLAHIKPALVTLEYEQLRFAIKEICAQEIPQLHEVTRVLKHMSEIAATDQSSTPVIDFDDTEKRLHVTDPFFAFYLRWGNID